MDIISWSFKFLWDNFFTFMNYQLDFGDVSFSLWEFLLGSLIIFGILVFIIRRIFE